MPLYGYSEQVAEFVARILKFPRGFGECKAIGVVDRNNVLIGGAVYHNYCPETGVIELTAASMHPRWANKTTVRAIFGYPFDIGCQMVVGRTAEDNPAPLRVWRSLGADFHRIPRLRGRDMAEIITTLTAEQWAETRFAHGQAKSPVTA